MELVNYIGAGLAVGLAGIGVAIGQGILAKSAVEVMGKRKEMASFFLTITILGIALVESAVIYGLIVGFQILAAEGITLSASIGAGLAIGLAGLGAGVGEGKLIGGAIRAMDRNPEMRGKLMTFMVLFVALVESAAIYGLVVAFKILGADDYSSMSFLGMGMAIGFAGLGVSIGEGILAENSMEVIGKKSELVGFFLTVTILGIALVESAAIYGLIVSFKIMATDTIVLAASVGAGLAIGLAGLGAGIGEGKLVGGAIRAMDKSPEMRGKIMTMMVLFIALVESAAIYGLVVSFKILGLDDYTSMSFLGMGLAIGLAGLGVSIGEGILAEKSMEMMGEKPKLIGFFLTVTILGIALVESAAIYGLVVAFDVLAKELPLYAASGAGVAIGLAGLGAGIGEGILVSGAISSIAKNPEMKGKLLTLMVLFVALVEVTAIYGMIIAFKISGNFGADTMVYLGSGLAIGLAGLGVGIGRGYLSEGFMEIVGKRSNMMSFLLTVAILGVALVESAAIYALIVSFQILDNATLTGLAAVGAGLAIGGAGLGAGLGEGKLIKGALRAMDNNPEIKGKIMTLMVLFVALVESAAIYGLVISFKILGADDYSSMAFLGMGLSIGLAGLGVSIGEGILAEKSMEVIGERAKMTGFFLTVTILGIALVESAAIYGLVVAFDVFAKDLPLFAATGAGLAIGLAGLGAGVGEGVLVKGAMTSIARNPAIKAKILTLMVLFVALVEVTAIYGLIIAFKISAGVDTDSMIYLGAGLAVGLAGLGVGIGRGYLSEGSLEIIGKNPRMTSFLLTISILGVALVESAAIYALIVSFQILGIDALTGLAGLGAGLAIGLTGLGAGVGEGLLIKGTVDGMNKAPEVKGKTLTFMVLFVALIEVVAIYGLIVAFQILG